MSASPKTTELSGSPAAASRSTARAVLAPGGAMAPVPRRLFGSFVEHLGRCVYTGIYEPGHPTADSDGFRQDVIDLVTEMGVTVVRYPGGNFVSAYRWRDGIGPKDQRPARLDLAWHSLEPNQFGTDEFLAWCTKTGIEPMWAVNLGTAGVLEAVDLLDYVNGRAPTAMVAERTINGHAEPYGVRMWCLGNEMDGPWQVGHKSAQEYATLAANTARALRLADPNVELVACGSSGPWMPTFGEWERVVLDECYDDVDYISLHRYYEEKEGDLASFLASGADLDRFIEGVIATADHVRAKKHSDKTIQLSVDEWNVWYQSREESVVPSGDDWPVGPRLLEDKYTVADAVVVGGLLISLLKHADRVTAACQAQLVNVIAPIMAEPDGPAWRQTTFYPFAQTSRLATGVVLPLTLDIGRHETAEHGEVSDVDGVASWDEASGTGAVFLINRTTDKPIELTLDLEAMGGRTVTAIHRLSDDDPYRRNGPGDEGVVPQAVTPTGNTLTLPPVSWTVVEIG